MSFLRKRSRSQCSFSRGDDEISVRRPQDESSESRNRNSRVESISSVTSCAPSVDAAEFAARDSCVLRIFPKHKSSHLRFLVWVAYTRKYTDESMTDDERRTCPLLWCRAKFSDQEAMLQHVWNCPHLSKGLYWCCHCQRRERIGKFPFKGCHGTQSRTDRLATVAKKIFSKLGSHNHKKDSFLPPYEELNPTSDNWTTPGDTKSKAQQTSESFDGHAVIGWDHQQIQELPSNSICPEMAGDWTAASQELPDSYISEMMGSDCPIELGTGSESWADNFYAADLDEWNIAPTAERSKHTSPKLPRLDTSMSSINPSNLCENPTRTDQQVSPSTWSDAPLSATIISPMSAMGVGGGFDQRFTLEISPTDTVASGMSFFTDSGYTSATSMSASCSRTSSLNDTKGKGRDWECKTISEEHGNLFLPETPVVLPVSVGPHSNQIPNSALSISRSTSRSTIPETTRDPPPHFKDATSLVQSLFEVLDAHMHHTKLALQGVYSDPDITELLAMSKTSLVSIGLEVLAGILEGRNPTSIMQIFAFTHVACACAISLDYDNARIHTKDWFQESLSWASDLTPNTQREIYEQIARTVWQPLVDIENSKFEGSRSLSNSNQLLSACRHFLDILESIQTEQRKASKNSTWNTSFDFAQVSFEFKAKSRVLDKLITAGSIEAFIADVVKVGQRLQQGHISTVRELELELIYTGKLASQSVTAYSRFLNHVTRLTDELYAEESSLKMSRIACHIQDIALIKRLLPEEIYAREIQPQDQQSNIDFLIDLEFEPDTNNVQYSIGNFAEEADGILNSHTPKPRTGEPSLNSSLLSHPSQSIAPALPGLLSPLPASKPQIISKLRCHCGYIPTGAEKWKPSNLRRHKRTQHSISLKVYKCRWPGCKSEYTRSDNLRSHQREKGHHAKVRLEKYFDLVDEDELEKEVDNGTERPAKRRKGGVMNMGGGLS